MTAEEPPVHIRGMTLVDVDAVCAIAEQLPQAPHWPRTSYVNALDPDRSPKRIALVAADMDGSVAGFCLSLAVSPQAELESIAVAPGHQRQGIARRLLARLFAELKEQSVTEVILEVRASNWTAQAYYAAMGFAINGRRRRYYADPEEDALHLTRQIGGAASGSSVSAIPDGM